MNEDMMIDEEVLDVWLDDLMYWYGHHWTHEDMELAYSNITARMLERTEVQAQLLDSHMASWDTDINLVPQGAYDGTVEREILQAELCRLVEHEEIDEPDITEQCVWGKIALAKGNSWA